MAKTSKKMERSALTILGGDTDGQVLDSRSPSQRERTAVEMFRRVQGARCPFRPTVSRGRTSRTMTTTTLNAKSVVTEENQGEQHE